jgi:hypothetical protein
MAHIASARTLEVALRLACERIADSAQAYEEVNSAEGWASVFIEAAESGRTPADVLGSRPEPTPMTDAERSSFRTALQRQSS